MDGECRICGVVEDRFLPKTARQLLPAGATEYTGVRITTAKNVNNAARTPPSM